MVAALVLFVAGASSVLAVHLDDDIAPVATQALLCFASIFAVELHAVLCEHALTHRASIEALYEFVAELSLDFDDLKFGCLFAAGALLASFLRSRAAALPVPATIAGAGGSL